MANDASAMTTLVVGNRRNHRMMKVKNTALSPASASSSQASKSCSNSRNRPAPLSSAQIPQSPLSSGHLEANRSAP